MRKIVFFIVTIVASMFFLVCLSAPIAAEAGAKKAKEGRIAKKEKRGDRIFPAEGKDLEALIIEKRKEFLRDAQKPPDPEHDLEIKQKHGIVTLYPARRVDLPKLYSERPLRHL